MIKRIFYTVLFLSLSSTAFSAKWTSDAELGVVVTSGNSETQTANAKIKAKRETSSWVDSGSLEALGTSSTDQTTGEKVTTAEKYVANLKAEYKITPENFYFANANYIDDRFSGYEYQATLTVGVGRRLIKTEKQELSIELGPGVRFYKLSPDPITNARTPSDHVTIGRGALNYLYNFTEHSKFTQDLLVESGKDATITESVSALTAQINGKMAMKASVKVRHSSQVPDDSKKTDSETALTLVYSLK